MSQAIVSQLSFQETSATPLRHHAPWTSATSKERFLAHGLTCKRFLLHPLDLASHELLLRSRQVFSILVLLSRDFCCISWASHPMELYYVQGKQFHNTHMTYKRLLLRLLDIQSHGLLLRPRQAFLTDHYYLQEISAVSPRHLVSWTSSTSKASVLTQKSPSRDFF